MQNVSESSNYSPRAQPRGADEIGKLLGSNRIIVAIIYLDLDRFKLVNDTLGHAMGDWLLCEVADRLRSRVRTSDTPARLRDEFAVVAVDLYTSVDATMLAGDLLAQFSAPLAVDDHEFSLTVSVGISCFPKDAIESEKLIYQADTAMYGAKTTGKNMVIVFTGEFGEAVKRRLELEYRLRGAIMRGKMFIRYQPQFEASTNRLVSFEALARWSHPTFGLMPPTKLIPIAEETGLIIPIGLWIMEQACIEASKRKSLAESPVQVAVNISTIQLMNKDFAPKAAEILKRTGLKPAFSSVS